MVDFRWGADDRTNRWADALFEWGGDPALIAAVVGDESVQRHYAFDVLYGDGPRYWWTGQGDVSALGRRYAGIGNVVGVSQLGAEEGNAKNAVRLGFIVRNDEDLNLFSRDPGILVVTIRMFFSADGEAWSVFPRSFTGRVTSATITDREYSIEVADKTWDTTRTKIQEREWSPEAQQRFDLSDRGLEHLGTLADEGVEIRWPT